MIDGKEKVEAPPFSIEVSDCNTAFKFIGNQRLQVGSKNNIFNLVVENTDPICIGEQFKINGTAVEGIEIDPDTGDFVVSVEKSFKRNKIVVSYVIGLQQLYSTPFDIEVYDCAYQFDFPKIPDNARL